MKLGEQFNIYAFTLTSLSFYRLFILNSEVLAPSEGRQIRVRLNFLDVLGSLDALITKEKISGFLIYIYIIKILSTLLL